MQEKQVSSDLLQIEVNNQKNKMNELKSVPKSPVNDYRNELLNVQDTKNSIITAQSNQSRDSSSSRRSLELDRELIRQKLKAINSIKNRLQQQMGGGSASAEATSESNRNAPKFQSHISSNLGERTPGNTQEAFIGNQIKLTNEKQQDPHTNSGSFQGYSRGASEPKNPFAFRSAGYSPLNSQNQHDGTTITMDGVFKKSGGTSYDAQNETHNFPCNRTSRLVNTNSTVPIPTSATQAADIETISSDIKMAEAVDTTHNPAPVTQRLTITDLAIASDPVLSDPIGQPSKQIGFQTGALTKLDSHSSKAPISNLSHISNISPANQLTQNLFSATQMDIKQNQEPINKQFTVHDYNRHFPQTNSKDKKGQKQANASRGMCNESPNLGDTKFHQTDGTNIEQLTDLQNPLENLTQTLENDDYGQINKKLSSLRGSVNRADFVRNSPSRTERNSNDCMQDQGQGGNNPNRANTIRGTSSHNQVSQGADQKPSNGTYSKLSERSVSSLGQTFSNQESNQAHTTDILHNQNQNVGRITPKTQGNGKQMMPDIMIDHTNGLSQNRLLQIGGKDIGTINRKVDPRQSLDINSVQTRESQFIGPETCKNLFLNDALISHDSNNMKWYNYQQKEDFSIPKSPKKPTVKHQKHKSSKSRDKIDLLLTPKSRGHAQNSLQNSGQQAGYFPSKYSTQLNYANGPVTATPVVKKNTNSQFKNSPKNREVDSQLNHLQRSNTTSAGGVPISPKKVYKIPLFKAENDGGSQQKLQKALVTSNFQKKNPPSFRAGHGTDFKQSKKTSKQVKERSGLSNDGHIRVQLLRDRDDHYRKLQLSASKSSTSSRFRGPSIDTWSSESQDASKRHVWTYQNQHDDNFIQIFTPATEASRKQQQTATTYPMRVTEQPITQLRGPGFNQFNPPATTRPKAATQFGKPVIVPSLKLPLQGLALPKPRLTDGRIPKPHLQLQNANQDLDVLTQSAAQSQSSRMQSQNEYGLDSAKRQIQEASHKKQKPQTNYSDAKKASRYQSEQTSDPYMASNDLIDNMMAKNKEIIQEQKQILANYQSNYEKLQAKYNHLKQVKYKQLKAENKMNLEKIKELEDTLQEVKKQQLKRSDIKILTPGRQGSSSGSRSRDRSPLSLKLAVATGESRMSLQYKYDALNQKYQILQEQLTVKKSSDLKNNESLFNDNLHNFERHNKLKMKLYYKMNDLAWKYRSKVETGQEETANGRELPVKDLWRWFKQMYKVWKQQNYSQQSQQIETEVVKQIDESQLTQKLMMHLPDSTPQTNQSKDTTTAQNKDQTRISLHQEVSSPAAAPTNSGPFNSKSISPGRDNSQKRLETHSACSQQRDSKVSSLQKMLCMKLSIENSLSYQEKKSMIVERVEALQKQAEEPRCEGCDRQEQLTLICQHLEIQEGLESIKAFIEDAEERNRVKSDVHLSLEEQEMGSSKKQSKFPSISITQASLENLPVQSQDQNQGNRPNSGSQIGTNIMDDTITRAKLDNLESQLKEDLAFEKCWANVNDQDSFLMNDPSNRHSKDSSRLLRESSFEKQSIRELSLIKDAESKEEPNSSTFDRGLLQPDQNPFQVTQSQLAKDSKSAAVEGVSGEQNQQQKNQMYKRGNSDNQARHQHEPLTEQFSSIQMARISLESQIKEEDVEESRDDLDSQGNIKNRASQRPDDFSSFIAGESAQDKKEYSVKDPRNSHPPSRSSFGSPASRAASQADNQINDSQINMPAVNSEVLDTQ